MDTSQHIDVHLGDHVTRGQTVAAVGNSGRSTGPHLHYEVRINGNPENPRKFILDDGRARRTPSTATCRPVPGRPQRHGRRGLRHRCVSALRGRDGLRARVAAEHAPISANLSSTPPEIS